MVGFLVFLRTIIETNNINVKYMFAIFCFNQKYFLANLTMKRKLKLILFLGLIFILPLLTIQFSSINQTLNSRYSENSNENKIKSADFWDLTGTPIFINGTATGVDAHNWTWVENQIWFGGGNGSWNNLYIIENITIDGLGTGSCIEIINSEEHFIIRNCTVFNSGTEWDDAGVYFTNISNGQIVNCSTSFNEHGIALFNSSDCLIKDCYIIDNDFTGIMVVDYSYNNKIINNSFIEETIYPDAFIYSDVHCYYTEISSNTFLSSSGRSEAMDFYDTVYYLNISNNRIVDCFRGIKLGGKGHITANNILTYNLSKAIPSREGITVACVDSFIFNNTIDYYMNGILVVGYNNDIIGNKLIGNVSPMLHIELVTNDAEKTYELLHKLFGSEKVEIEFADFLDTPFMHIIHVNLSNVVLQYCQPLVKKGVPSWSELLDKNGSYVHNITFVVDNIPETAEKFKKEGITPVFTFPLPWDKVIENVKPDLPPVHMMNTFEKLGFHLELGETVTEDPESIKDLLFVDLTDFTNK